MQSRFFKLLSILTCFFLLAIQSPQCIAKTSEKQLKKQQLQELQSRIKKLQHTIAVKQDSKSQYVKQLKTIEKKIGSLNNKIKHSEKLILASQLQLKKLSAQKLQQIKALAKDKYLLEKQIYGAYLQGKNSQLQMLFNQDHSEDLQRQLMFYQYFAKHQSLQIEQVKHAIQTLQSTEQKIQREKTTLTQTKQNFVSQKRDLANDRLKRKKIVANLDHQLKNQSKQLHSLNEDAEQLKKLIASINEIFKNNPAPRKPFYKLKGKLPWPVQGKLRTLFGHLKPLSNLKWKGHIIYAPEGRHVKAISAGRIAYADWLKGFGNLIIINHGNGYLSLYGHNQSLYKSPGEWVEKGEIIGSAGDSGGVKKSGIYFEIRKKSTPQNPSIWCNRKNKFSS